MGNFKDLSVWAKAHALTLGLYKTTQKFPREEIFGLDDANRTSEQLNRRKSRGGMWSQERS